MADENDKDGAVDGAAVDAIAKGLKQRAGVGTSAATRSPANDSLKGGSGADTVAGSGGTDTIPGGSGGEAKPPTGGAAGAQTPSEELLQLRERVARMELDQRNRDARRNAENFTDEFIRSHSESGIPVELMRRFLPVTENKDQLMGELQKLDGMLRSAIDFFVKKGRIRYVEINGRSGGKLPGDVSDMSRTFNVQSDPVELIKNGLQSRRR